MRPAHSQLREQRPGGILAWCSRLFFFKKKRYSDAPKIHQGLAMKGGYAAPPILCSSDPVVAALRHRGVEHDAVTWQGHQSPARDDAAPLLLPSVTDKELASACQLQRQFAGFTFVRRTQAHGRPGCSRTRPPLPPLRLPMIIPRWFFRQTGGPLDKGVGIDRMKQFEVAR